MVVDVHVHIGWVRSLARNLKGWVYADLEDLRGYMDECGVEKAFVLSVPEGCDPYAEVVSNEVLLKTVLGDERLVPFCIVDPRFPGAVERLERLVRMGCMGVGEFKVPIRADDERSLEILKVAEDYGLPVLFHMEDGRYFYDIHALENVLRIFSDVNFVAHGPGWWRHISKRFEGEHYPKGEVEVEGEVQRLLRTYRNIYVDISATSGLNALSRDPDHARRFLTEFSDRVLFGTDFPCLAVDGGEFGLNRKHMRFLKSLGLPDNVLKKILHSNAERLIKRY
ncbi:MAG: amidohydrolase [Candidatus Bathyarchaeota archaeon B26-2]|nr:MAG: amidohydrolase [Candidatus Bathyarchaeota archaeon B26-2]